jgi:hypothetical protein
MLKIINIVSGLKQKNLIPSLNLPFSANLTSWQIFKLTLFTEVGKNDRYQGEIKLRIG